MEGKEKIVLNDGTEYPIETGASENQVRMWGWYKPGRICRMVQSPI